MSDIKAVLFDFGGVFTLSPFGAVEMLANERGLDPLEFAGIVFGPYHLDVDHPWHRLERGEISLEDSRQGIMDLSRDAGCEVDLFDVLMKMAEANSGNVVNDDVVQLLVDVKQQGYHTAIVTNNVKEFSDHWQAMLPMEHVDVVVDSAFEGVRKPGPDIFHLTLEKLPGLLQPQDCLFIDDVEANIEAAKGLGMNGVLASPDPQQIVADVKNALADSDR